MSRTMADELCKFLAELKAYNALPRTADDPEGDARHDVVKAHLTRVSQILEHPVHDPAEVRLNILPEDMCVWVVLPGQTAVMLASDATVTVPPHHTPSQRDRAVIRALLQTATRENEEAGRPEGVQMPYITAPPYPSGGF